MKRAAFVASLGACLVACLLVGAPAAACEIEGLLIGVIDVGEVDGIRLVAPVLDDAVGDCSADVVAVMPDPWSRVQISTVPQLAADTRVRLLLRPGGDLGTHLVVRALEPTGEGARLDRVPAGASGVRKSGNGQPPCTRGRWRTDEPIVLEVHEAGSADIFTDRDLRALDAAAAAWGTPACAASGLMIGETFAELASLDEDGRNTVQWLEDQGSIFDNIGAESIGFTCHVCDDDGYYVETDVRFDGRRTWSTDCDGFSFDVLGAALHEFGHVLGVPHLDDPTAVMFPVTSARRLLATRVLGAGDTVDLCERYPCPDGRDCSAPVDEDPACPAGDGICSPCGGDRECGAEPDRCLQNAETGELSCARACSPSFPCPTGYECVSVGPAPMQCVPVGASCRDIGGFVGCPCDTDDDCGEAGDRCLSEGVCGADCDGGVACPTTASCTMIYEDGIPTGRQCVPGPDHGNPCRKRGKRGCDCGTSGRGAVPLWTLLAFGVVVVRRRTAG